MFSKVLIANRGEIACRVMRTCNRLGIKTVAVYSDADADALHVRCADEGVRIGAPAASDSYLKIDALIEACRATGAEAVHPGYGFLSENPDFVEAVKQEGLVFVGPSADAMRAMGLKDAAKALMETAGVPVVPGYHGDRQDIAALAAEAEEIGFPVLIKARAGGGGKGMRLVERADDFAAALSGAQGEARSSFGDDAVLLEKYLRQARHIEVQIFGDSHGNVVHLFERDCSLQRRHQKVIEEAPAPGMTDDIRAEMGAAAVRAAKAINYEGAGTIEFIVDTTDGLKSDGFYFMEMNTRLQVEHPVTEVITGQDLVEWQLRIAAGEPLPKKQDDLSIDGWAVEARIYAENPATGFLPATGEISHFDVPVDRIRFDSGVEAGDEVTPHYDPMVAKMIAHGPDRDTALSGLIDGLQATRIAGVVTNVGFLTRVAGSVDFQSGAIDTGLLDRQGETWTGLRPIGAEELAAAAIASVWLRSDKDTVATPWTGLSGWRHWEAGRYFATLVYDDQSFEVSGNLIGDGSFAVETSFGKTQLMLVDKTGDGFLFSTDASHQPIWAGVSKSGATVIHGGDSYRIGVPDPLEGDGASHSVGNDITSPLPGTVKSVLVCAGASVAVGEPFAIVEAMKMEHTLKAQADCVVDEVLVAAGDLVKEGQPLLTLQSLTP